MRAVKIKHSIKRQFALIFIGLMAGTILLCWFINIIFLEQYYISSKMEVILEAYESIRRAANSDTYNGYGTLPATGARNWRKGWRPIFSACLTTVSSG